MPPVPLCLRQILSNPQRALPTTLYIRSPLRACPRLPRANTKSSLSCMGAQSSSPTALAFKRDFTQSSYRHSRRKEEDQPEESSLNDDLETEATARLIEDGINEVIDRTERASRERTSKNASGEEKWNDEIHEASESGTGESATEGETSGMGMDDLLGDVVGGDGGDIGIGDVIGELGGFVDF